MPFFGLCVSLALLVPEGPEGIGNAIVPKSVPLGGLPTTVINGIFVSSIK